MEWARLEQGCDLLGASKKGKDISQKMLAYQGVLAYQGAMFSKPLQSGFLFLSLYMPFP